MFIYLFNMYKYVLVNDSSFHLYFSHLQIYYF